MAYRKDSIKKPLTICLTDDLRKQVEEKARQECRSRNSLIEYALKVYLQVTKK